MGARQHDKGRLGRLRDTRLPVTVVPEYNPTKCTAPLSRYITYAQTCYCPRCHAIRWDKEWERLKEHDYIEHLKAERLRELSRGPEPDRNKDTAGSGQALAGVDTDSHRCT